MATPSAITSSLGSYFFNDVAPGLHRINIERGTPVVASGSTPAGSASAKFSWARPESSPTFSSALDNLADRDWGDLPDSYNTLNGNARAEPLHCVGASGFPASISAPASTAKSTDSPTGDATGDDVVGVQRTTASSSSATAASSKSARTRCKSP